MARNPNWTREEIILAVNLYLASGRKQLDKRDPRVVELSELLNKLPIHSQSNRETKFRNPTGVSMKLGNISAIDPESTGAGLARGNRLEAEIWEKYGDDPRRLAALAESITANIDAAKPEQQYSPELDEEEFEEGRVLTRVHKARERSRLATQKKKDSVLKRTGALACEACGFDFKEVYGDLGEGFAECHHTVPVSQLQGGQKTRLSELAILCANCHRMIHKSKPMLTVAQLRSRMSN